ncbi:hypothetical protein MUK42_05884 [Musa troglodytarum]|uniref:PLAC8 family protein n=1 Tax=Musa troglodytarum TaxID=320322 RepID=A0A9E7EYX0_9LILI|nr:hypothetical protein MUK42_05884 [Musa troglodytarum]
MESNGSCQGTEDTKAAIEKSERSMTTKLSCFIRRKEEQFLDQTRHARRFLDFLKAQPSKDWLLRFGFVGRSSPFTFVKRTGSQRGGSSPPDCAPVHGCRPLRVPFVRRINWEGLIMYCKNWVKHPMNIALLVWLFFVAVGLLVLFLFMTGLLDHTIPKSSQRKRWTEITNQIVNALFTIMCIYQHPKLFHHLVLLCRWRSTDVAELRKVYSKNGAPRPNEWAHMMLVVLLLHTTCFSQYGLCGIYWGYSSESRPTWPQILFIVLGIAAPIAAGIYVVYGPLGKKQESETDVESPQMAAAAAPDTDQLKTRNKRVVITKPEWVGGLFDCWDDLTVASLSVFCTLCVFGWNMERLGFGNIYTTGVTGILLCFCGLLYGGFWRIQMRKRFKLPANPFCCGYPAMTDFMQWLFCWSCSLAQEVRTGNFYDIEEDSFHQKGGEDESSKLHPLPREGGMGPLTESSSLSHSYSNPHTGNSNSKPHSNGTATNCVRINIDEAACGGEKDDSMTPPLQPLVQLRTPTH